MEERKLKYYKLAKFPTFEILMEGQIASAGAHQARLIEKFKKNKNFIRNQFLALKLIFTFMFVFLPLLPLVTYLQVAEELGGSTYSVTTIAFISSFIFAIYFIITLLYMLMFGMVSTSSFMSGNSFKWLQTLPFSKKELKKIGFMTLFRNLDIPLIVLMFSFPIIMLIFTGNVLIFFTTLLISILNVVFNFSLLVIVGEKLSSIFSETRGKSKRVNVVRMITMMGYFVIAFGSGLMFTYGFSAIDTFLNIFKSTEPPTVINSVLSLIPFPFAPGYLLTLSAMPLQFPSEVLINTLIGVGLYGLITWGLLTVARRALRSTISSEITIEKEESKEIKVEITRTSSILAYIKKDLVSSIRDIQSFMFIFFPIFYPLILVLTLQAGVINEINSTGGILALWSIILAVYLFIPPMLVAGFLNLEESGSSTVASLPILPRDQAKAKLILMLGIQGLSLIIMSITLVLMTNSMVIFLLLLATLPIAWTLVLVMFEVKIHFFGKMKYKYVIEELNKEHKYLKWILMILIEGGIYFGIMMIGIVLLLIFNILTALLILMVIGIGSVLSLIFAFTRMFPKFEKMAEYKTGGFLREHVNVGILVLLVLYFIWGFLLFPIILLISPLFSKLSFTGVIIINFVLNFGFLALLWLIAVPYGLKLPKKETFKEFTQTIGLSKIKPVWNNILLGIGIFYIYVLSALYFTIILGDINFVHWYLENPHPAPDFSYLGWFLFIFMLIPGIWEEVAFRGVILNLQRKKYSQTTAVILNGVIFGLYHLVNLVWGLDWFGTILQVIYTSCLGVTLAYVFMRTRSLIPCIIVHYLFNSVGQVFFNGIFPNLFIESLFAMLAIGVFPMIIVILLIKLFYSGKRT
ncbi:MAG: CPBP family glutamic-type intramembrane protease [Promethearchaeota archaeon]|jgi:membrane protease YdiL (CAAX protease family)/predicted permease